MKEQLLAQIGMNDSSFGTDMLLYGIEPDKPVAAGYYLEDTRNVPYAQYDIIRLASGTFQSTMVDMVRFMQFMLDDSRNLVSQETLHMMYESQATGDRDPKTNGLAWMTDEDILVKGISMMVRIRDSYR